MGSPRILRIPELADEPGLVHGFSTAEWGSVGLTHTADREAVGEVRRRFATKLGLDPAGLTAAGAVHGASVARVDEPHEVVKGVDALVTNRPGVALFATYADCFPIVLWDGEHGAVGLVHAGWRGTEAGVTRAALARMEADFGTRPAHVRAGIGPGICGRCYEVGLEVADRFDGRFVSPSATGRLLLDLAEANREQLAESGVRDIFRLDVCTRESDQLPSHRRAPDGARFGAIVAVR